MMNSSQSTGSSHLLRFHCGRELRKNLATTDPFFDTGRNRSTEQERTTSKKASATKMPRSVFIYVLTTCFVTMMSSLHPVLHGVPLPRSKEISNKETGIKTTLTASPKLFNLIQIRASAANAVKKSQKPAHTRSTREVRMRRITKRVKIIRLRRVFRPGARSSNSTSTVPSPAPVAKVQMSSSKASATSNMKSAEIPRNSLRQKNDEAKPVSALPILPQAQGRNEENRSQNKDDEERKLNPKPKIESNNLQQLNEKLSKSSKKQVIKNKKVAKAKSSPATPPPTSTATVPEFSETLDVKSDDIENTGFTLTDEFPIVVEGLSSNLDEGDDNTDNVTIDISGPPTMRRGQIVMNMSVVTNDIRLDNAFISRLTSCLAQLSREATRSSDWYLYSAGRFAQGLVQLEFYVVVQHARADEVMQIMNNNHESELKSCTQIPKGGDLFTSRKPTLHLHDGMVPVNVWLDVVRLGLLMIVFFIALSACMCLCHLFRRPREQRRFRNVKQGESVMSSFSRNIRILMSAQRWSFNSR